MAWKPNDETQNRVLYALRLMQSNGWGIERAAKVAKTTRRSVRKYGQHLGVKFKGKEGTALQFVGQPIQKIEDFLIRMHRGDSASKAAKDLKTTVRTMSKQTYKGSPIIKKEKGRWVSQFIPEEKIVMQFYGHIRNPQGNILGGNNVSGPDATSSKNKKKRDPDYMEIWWDAFVYDFGTTFGTPGEAQRFWKDKIVKVIKDNMESLGIQDANLMNRFSTNATVALQMQQDSRVPPPYTVSPLEQVTERYGVSLEGAKVGTATTYQSRSNINLIPKSKFGGKQSERDVEIQFQVSYLGEALKSYPTTKKFSFKYSLDDEN
ncbi:hypothetical protein CMK18_21595 [Candidatus Poribacteria bacterium]|nr:hypothetical protein [Candidatus Poribacteria bacterium]